MPCRGSQRFGKSRLGYCLALLLCAGCQTLGQPHEPSGDCPPGGPDGAALLPGHHQKPDLPHEHATVALPPYVINPPDVLQVDAVSLVPKPPYKVNPLDVLGIQVTGTPQDAPINGLFTVEPDGTVALGFNYGNVRVDGLTLNEVKKAISDHLKTQLMNYTVNVTLAQSRGLQQVRGPHLVRPDGTIGLGVYGSVSVDNMTIAEAKAAIEEHLSAFVVKPEVSVDVAGFNSKVYYIITAGAGPGGDLVTRLPVTGETTVLDALSNVQGLSPVSTRHCIYLVRPSNACKQKDEEVYKIDYNAVVKGGQVATNYQVLPGDRIYLYPAPMIKFDTYLSLFLAPFERAFADVSLGNGTVRSFITPISRNPITLTPGF